VHVGNIYGYFRAAAYLQQAAGYVRPGIVSHYIMVALSAALLGFVMFLIGVVLHAAIARKTGNYQKSVWILIFVMSVLLCFAAPPTGAVLGGVTLLLLFTLKTFKRMRDAGQAVPDDSATADTPEP